MMALSRTFLIGSTALLLGGTAALAQEACTTYKVQAGDNLRYIARTAYGDADLYRVIYDANVATIGEKADLIEIGTEPVGVLAVATVAGAAAELRERRVPRLGTEHTQEGRRVERAGADLDVDGLLDHAAVIGPEPLELEDQVL